MLVHRRFHRRNHRSPPVVSAQSPHPIDQFAPPHPATSCVLPVLLAACDAGYALPRCAVVDAESPLARCVRDCKRGLFQGYLAGNAPLNDLPHAHDNKPTCSQQPKPFISRRIRFLVFYCARSSTVIRTSLTLENDVRPCIVALLLFHLAGGEEGGEIGGKSTKGWWW